MLHRTLRSLLVAGFAIGSLGALTGTAAADDTEWGLGADDADWNLAAGSDDSASADPEPQSSWDANYDWYDSSQDAGGVDVRESLNKSTNNDYLHAEFWAYGERLQIQDNHDNGRPAIAKLWVGDSGPSIFYANPGDSDGPERTEDLSFAEDQGVYLQVCTSDSPNALCTDKVKYQGRT